MRSERVDGISGGGNVVMDGGDELVFCIAWIGVRDIIKVSTRYRPYDGLFFLFGMGTESCRLDKWRGIPLDRME